MKQPEPVDRRGITLASIAMLLVATYGAFLGIRSVRTGEPVQLNPAIPEMGGIETLLVSAAIAATGIWGIAKAIRGR